MQPGDEHVAEESCVYLEETGPASEPGDKQKPDERDEKEYGVDGEVEVEVEEKEGGGKRSGRRRGRRTYAVDSLGVNEVRRRYHYVERFRRNRAQLGRGTREGGGGGRVDYGTLEGKGLVVVVRVRGTVQAPVDLCAAVESLTGYHHRTTAEPWFTGRGQNR